MTRPTPAALDVPTKSMVAKIVKQYLGCRVGNDIDGAAYCLSDIGGSGKYEKPDTIDWPMELHKWMSNPENFGPQWTDRLWNTCAFIVNSARAGTILVVTNAIPTGERYLNTVDARGDGYTFAKSNRLPSNSDIVNRIPYKDGDGPAEIYRRIYDALY